MKVTYWPVGAGKGSSKSTELPVTLDEISQHLLADWLPSRPSGVAKSVFGWPTEMLELMHTGNKPVSSHWIVRQQAGGTERQWKGVVSWMLGVAGTRHVLADEGYRWVAPLSAFYPETKTAVNVSGWHSSFRPAKLEVHRKPGNQSILRPDYVALRRVGKKFEWAVAESKGTTENLADQSKCKRHWTNQSKNAVLRMAGLKTELPLSRHLVVATRINPNNAAPSGRKVQIRAWNSFAPDLPEIPFDAAIEVVGAHLHGLFNNLDMGATAQAIADAVEELAVPRALSDDRRSRRDQAEQELATFKPATRERPSGSDRTMRREISSAMGPVAVELDPAIADLTRQFISLNSRNGIAAAIRSTDAELDKADERLRGEFPERYRARAGAGVSLTLPPERFQRR